MAAEALEKSALESKDKDQLMAIADALGVKTTARASKTTLVEKILEKTGASDEPARTDAPRRGRPPKARVGEEGAPAEKPGAQP